VSDLKIGKNSAILTHTTPLSFFFRGEITVSQEEIVLRFSPVSNMSKLQFENHHCKRGIKSVIAELLLIQLSLLHQYKVRCSREAVAREEEEREEEERDNDEQEEEKEEERDDDEREEEEKEKEGDDHEREEEEENEREEERDDDE
jgi:flagellar biosynthesis/type III secretory pathway M-ring protein FliF/YscJ